MGETTLRRRRDEWVRAGLFGGLVDIVLNAYDRVAGLDPSEVSIDGSQHKAPGGGPGTGPNGTDRGKQGWKWSLATDRNGIPLAWTPAPANRNDSVLLDDTFDALDARGYEMEVETVHLDRGYDYPVIRRELLEAGIEADISKKTGAPKKRRNWRKGPAAGLRTRMDLGARWAVERANSWLSNFGQLRRNTDRKDIHREAQLDFAVAIILTIKLVKWHNRYGAVLAA